MTLNVPVITKPLWKTKTFWLGLVVELLPLLEHVQANITLNPDWLFHVIGALIIIMRLATRQPASMTSGSTKAYIPGWRA